MTLVEIDKHPLKNNGSLVISIYQTIHLSKNAEKVVVEKVANVGKL